MNCHDIFNYTFYPALYPSISTGNSSVGGPGGSNAWKTQEISSEKIQRWELTGSGLTLMDELDSVRMSDSDTLAMIKLDKIQDFMKK